jgi:CHAD domain-containing protein
MVAANGHHFVLDPMERQAVATRDVTITAPGAVPHVGNLSTMDRFGAGLLAAETTSSRRLTLPTEGLKDACVAGFEAVLRYAAESLSRAHEDPVTAVHEYRKSLRRARSLLRMLRPSMSRRARRQIDVPLKEAHRSMSNSRDLAVIHDTFRELAESTGLEAPAISAALDDKRPAKIGLGAKPLRDPDDLVDLLAARLDPDLSIEDLGRGLASTYRRARRELARTLTVSDPAHVHALRRRCKDLNYQLEALVSRDNRKRLTETRKRLSRLASELGVITDLYQLQSSIAALPVGVPVAADALAQVKAATSEAIELRVERCLEAAKSALDLKPKAWVRSLKLR